MKIKRLGRTGLKVSELCLGTMQWGWTATEEQACRVMDAFFEAGGSFIDTADVYSRWHPGNPGGVSEEIIGRWLKSHASRHQVVLATKARGRMWEGPTGEGLSRAHLIKACEDSLTRLQTDYVDLYQAHAYDPDTPIEETLAAMDDLVHAGKVRYIGCSNYPAWRLAKALWTSEVHGLARYDSLQPHYNLAHRDEFERELMPLCEEEGLGVIPYSPLAAGFLTGKYRRDQAPESARAEGIKSRYFNERGFALIDQLDKVAAAHEATDAQIALAWLLNRAAVTAPIVGANTVEQLRETVKAVEIELSDEDIQELNKASAWQ
jgi:aryl-alcohol dehydrogenase-like predicted oxidoreductase